MLRFLRSLFGVPARSEDLSLGSLDNIRKGELAPLRVSDSQIPNKRINLLNPDGTANFVAIYTELYAHRGRPETFIDWLALGLEGDWFPSKVVGVSHRNDDHTSRQAAIRKLNILDSLELEPEPTNPYDKDAIRVLNEDDRQIGYLEKRLAGETSRAMRKGVHFLCFILDVTGDDQPTRGVNIAIVRWSPKSQP
jgi:hypothetical protein